MSASTTPVGTVLMYAGRTDGAGVLNLITAGWILCDGSVYPNSQFPDLFTVLGNSYGGTISLHAAMTRPDRVASLLLIEAHPVVDDKARAVCSRRAVGRRDGWVSRPGSGRRSPS